jgi:acyl carrier protein
MAPKKITSRLKAVLRDVVGFSEASLRRDNLTLFGSGGRIDSVGVLMLVMALEKQFGVIIDDGEILPKNFQTVKKLAAFIERKLSSPDVAQRNL